MLYLKENFFRKTIAKLLSISDKTAVDWFHIVQHMNRNFNQLRVVIMKQFSAKSTQQKTLKRYWKLLLKPSDELDEEKLRYNYHFKTYLTQAQLVEKL